MTDKQCAKCGEINLSKSNFCSNCGSTEFKDLAPGLAARLASATEKPAPILEVRISLLRVLVLSVLSFGLYFIYWFYLTWKQLASETTEKHHPVWHALSLFVPIYNLFKMHAHLRVAKELATSQGINSTMGPGMGVLLLLISDILQLTSLTTGSKLSFVLSFLGAALITTIAVMAQQDLNAYWEKVRSRGNLADASVGIGGVVVVVVGILVWLEYIGAY